MAGQRRRLAWLNGTVLGIGMASLRSDLSHETVTALPPGLLASLGVAAAALGTIEEVADGLSSAAKLYGGWWTDAAGPAAALWLGRSCHGGRRRGSGLFPPG